MEREHREVAGAIDAVSAAMDAYTGRKLKAAAYTWSLDGNGFDELLTPEWPLNSVTALTVDGSSITARRQSRVQLVQPRRELGGLRQLADLRPRERHPAGVSRGTAAQGEVKRADTDPKLSWLAGGFRVVSVPTDWKEGPVT